MPETAPAGAVRALAKRVGDDDLGGLAAELAYRFFLALFPFFIFLAALSGFITHLFDIQNPTDRIINTIGDTLPSDVTSVIRSQLEEVISSRNLALLSVGIVGTLWAASSAVGSLIKAMNRAYGVRETRPRWERYLLAIGLTVFAGAFLTSSFLVLVIGQAAGTKIADKLGRGGVAGALIPFIHWPASLALVLFAVGFLYRVAPNTRLSIKRILPGAATFTAIWFAATYVFGLYVAHFASYNSTYGALGGVAILMVWFYLTSFILLLGVELNALLELRTRQAPAGDARH
ncbi:MAG: YihY/virulence factor BrkB family protein [Dehalococcoidia bacterium]